MLLEINGRQEEFPINGASTVKDLVMKVGNRVLKQGDVTTDIKIVLQDDLEGKVQGKDLLDLDPEKISSLLVEVMPYKAFVQKQTNLARDFVHTLGESFGRVSDHLYHDDVDLGMKLFKDCIEGLSLFFQLLKDLENALGIDFEKIKMEGSPLTEHIKKFNAMLHELLDAMEQNDLVLINDYIRYELIPDLEKWENRVEIIRREVA